MDLNHLAKDCQVLLRSDGEAYGGWLRKQSSLQLKFRIIEKIFPWFQKYVIVSQGTLFLYQNDRSGKPSGIISLLGFDRVQRANEIPPEIMLWSFKLVHAWQGKVHYFSASSEREMKEWMLKIKHHMFLANKQTETSSTEGMDVDNVSMHRLEESIYGTNVPAVQPDFVSRDAVEVEEDEAEYNEVQTALDEISAGKRINEGIKAKLNRLSVRLDFREVGLSQPKTSANKATAVNGGSSMGASGNIASQVVQPQRGINWRARECPTNGGEASGSSSTLRAVPAVPLGVKKSPPEVTLAPAAAGASAVVAEWSQKPKRLPAPPVASKAGLNLKIQPVAVPVVPVKPVVTSVPVRTQPPVPWAAKSRVPPLKENMPVPINVVKPTPMARSMGKTAWANGTAKGGDEKDGAASGAKNLVVGERNASRSEEDDEDDEEDYEEIDNNLEVDLKSEKFFRAKVLWNKPDKNAADRFIKECSSDGMFLVRESENGKALIVHADGEMRKFRINQLNNQYCLGNDQHFPSLLEMLAYYVTHELPGRRTKLRLPYSAR